MPNRITAPLFDMSTNDLYLELGKAQQELLNLRFQMRTHQNSNYTLLSHAKRNVARLKTILRERELSVEHS
jgi:large subunit ribosomal protein L29